MKHLVEINDSSEIGRNLYTFLQTLAQKEQAVTFIESEDYEIEDTELLEMMLQAENSGEVNESEVLKSISRILDK
jgi:hypothetical protein